MSKHPRHLFVCFDAKLCHFNKIMKLPDDIADLGSLYVHLASFSVSFVHDFVSSVFLQVTYHCFHWKKGTPFADDQGIYNRLTWWEQMDNGKQLTPNRKFLTVVPVVL